jgi:hypothetical protein
MPSTCHQHAISMPSSCYQHAIIMSSACHPHAIRLPSPATGLKPYTKACDRSRRRRSHTCEPGGAARAVLSTCMRSLTSSAESLPVGGPAVDHQVVHAGIGPKPLPPVLFDGTLDGARVELGQAAHLWGEVKWRRGERLHAARESSSGRAAHQMHHRRRRRAAAGGARDGAVRLRRRRGGARDGARDGARGAWRRLGRGARGGAWDRARIEAGAEALCTRVLVRVLEVVPPVGKRGGARASW